MNTIVKNRWSVVIAGVLILMCLGAAYSWGVFLIPIDRETGWGRTVISFSVSILLLTFSIFMAIGGFLEKKIGPRKTASLGGFLVGFGWVLASITTSPFTLYLSYGVMAGIGTGLSYMPSISSGIKWFPDKKGLVTGIIVFGFGFGAAFLSPIITKLIAIYDWRTTMQICGIAFGAIIILAAQFLKNPLNNENMDIQNDSNAFSPIEMFKTRSFKIIFFTYFIAMIAGMMTIGHLIAFITDKNFNTMQAALALTFLSLFNGIGRIVFGYMSDFWGGKKILVLLFSLIGLMMIALYHANVLPIIYILSMIIGLCFGGFLAVYPAITADFFGRQNFSINYGFIFLGYGFGCFLGPLIGGLVYDSMKNYLTAFYFAGILAIIGGILIYFFLNKPYQVT